MDRYQLLIGVNDLVGPWVARRSGGTWAPGQGQTFGIWDSKLERITAGVLYVESNGANVFMHVAGEGKHWLTRKFLWICFDYPFNQLKLRRVTGVVPSSNLAARRFDEHLGFRLEAALKDAHPDGDLLVYSMTREQCRWLSDLKPPKEFQNHVEGRSTIST